MTAGTRVASRNSGWSLLVRTRSRSVPIATGHALTSSAANAVRIGAAGTIAASSASTRSPPRGWKNQ